MAASAGMSLVVGPMMVVAPGDEMLARIWVVTPTTPIFSPFTVMMVLGASFLVLLMADAACEGLLLKNVYSSRVLVNRLLRLASPLKLRLLLR